MTASTLIYSPLRYGLAVTGSMAYEQSLQKLDAAVINVTARKILGVGTSARLPTLHIGAGVKSMRNLYLQHCAEQLDSTMRATARSFQTKTYSWMQRTYKVSTWRPDTLTLEPSCAPIPRIYRFLFRGQRHQGTLAVQCPACKPDRPQRAASLLSLLLQCQRDRSHAQPQGAHI